MAGQLTIDTLKASSGVLGTQNGMTGIAKCWVTFTGMGAASVVASFNVSSVTRNSSGNYTVTFSTAMPSASYVAVASGNQIATYNKRGCVSPITYATGSLVVTCWDGSNTACYPLTTYVTDYDVINVAIFGA